MPGRANRGRHLPRDADDVVGIVLNQAMPARVRLLLLALASIALESAVSDDSVVVILGISAIRESVRELEAILPALAIK